MARSQEGYTSPHFSLLRKISKYDFLGGWMSFSSSFARETRARSVGSNGIPRWPSRVRKTDSVFPASVISILHAPQITSGGSLRGYGQLAAIPNDSTPDY